MKYLLLAILAGLSLSAQAAEIVYPPRAEIYSIPTLTISDKQFLQGDKNGKEVTVNGILRFPPKPVSQKIPVIFLVHGSSGMGPNVEYWSNHFLGEGYATFSLDGFTGRGLTVVGPNQALLGRLNLILDSYKAMEILAKHPRLDSSKFVMMGFSRGGQATLFASVERFNKQWNKSGTVFAAHIPFLLRRWQGASMLEVALPGRPAAGISIHRPDCPVLPWRNALLKIGLTDGS